MTDRDSAHGQDGNEIGNDPIVRNPPAGIRGQDNHGKNTNQSERDAELELANHLRYLDEEIAELGLLARRTPSHVDLEHVRQQGLRDVQRQTAQKDGQHDDPLEVFQQRHNERLLSDAVPHDGQRDIAQAVEDDDDAEPHLPAVDVVLVKIPIEPADSKVIGQGHDPRRPNGVVRANVADDGDLGCEADVGEQKATEQFGEWALVDPFAHRVEEKLVAAVGVLFPPCEFVVHRQADTLLKAAVCPGRQTDDVAVTL